MTFKIYMGTTFSELKTSACDFWDLKATNNYQLTDEYFNSLSSYNLPIREFFAVKN
jgi:lipopolysaccharide biosynthesis protein